MGMGKSMIVGICLSLSFHAVAAAAGDAERGKLVFAKCKACHTVDPAKHRFGPSLAGVVGRRAGTSAGYRYSKAMRAYGNSGMTWNEETLDVYLTTPRKAVKGTKMTFRGLKKKRDREDVISYLGRFSDAK